MTLRRRLALRYALVAAVCLALLAGLIHHEFVTEARQRAAPGLAPPPGAIWGEYAEVFFYAMVPVVLGGGWWFLRRTLAPVDQLAQRVERIHAGNLGERLPDHFDGDEARRLATAFNTLLARLELSFQQIRQFTLHVSHELKTPLTVIAIQFESLLREDKTQSPAQVEWLECQLAEVQRLGKIVDALMLLLKADAGLLALERKPVRLAEIVRESFEDAKFLAEASDIDVSLERCDEVELLGDRHRLRQLLVNLVDNAIKYNHAGGSVAMSLRQADGFAQLEITNTGAGLGPEWHEKVFERFVRGDQARSSAIEGSGLGLSICRWIVERHHGTIRLSSEPGRQTTVLARLPLTDAAPVASPGSTPPVSPPSAQGG